MKTSYVAPKGEQRLDHFLVQVEPEYSRGYFQRAISEGRVWVNNTLARKAGQVLKGGEAVEVEHIKLHKAPVAKDIPLDILYEDDQVLAINKPAGLVVHPNENDEEDTVVHAVLHHNQSISSAVHNPESAISQLRPGIVHRLDRDTSGVLLIAKTPEALQALSQQFKDHSIKKTYLALVSGIAKKETVRTGIARKPYRRTMMGVTKDGQGREAVTHFKPLQIFDYHGKPITLLECEIETGRTHQIRVHCKFRGHPVLGDKVYTNKTATELTRRLGIERQLLHAAKLEFISPINQRALILHAPLPEDFEAIKEQMQAFDKPSAS